MENEKEPLTADTTAEPTTENVETNSAQNVETPKVEEVKKNEKTYTQEEVNELIDRRFGREKAKTENLESDFEKNKEELNTLKAELEKANNTINEQNTQISEYKKKVAFSKYNIKDEFKEFIEYSVAKNVTEEKDFETALDEFMEKNSQKYIENGARVQMPRPENAEKVDEVVSIEEQIRKAMGL